MVPWPSGKAKGLQNLYSPVQIWVAPPARASTRSLRAGLFSDMILVAGRKRGKAVIYKKQRYAHKIYHTVGKQKLYWEVFIS